MWGMVKKIGRENEANQFLVKGRQLIKVNKL